MKLTKAILNSYFEVMKELGPGFLEKVYKNALLIAIRQMGQEVEVERPFEIMFRGSLEEICDVLISQIFIVFIVQNDKLSKFM